MEPPHMKPKTSNAKTVDHNFMTALIASLDALSWNVARVNAIVEKMGVEIASISGCVERVENQGSS